jgi:hypothetical protein
VLKKTLSSTVGLLNLVAEQTRMTLHTEVGGVKGAWTRHARYASMVLLGSTLLIDLAPSSAQAVDVPPLGGHRIPDPDSAVQR